MLISFPQDIKIEEKEASLIRFQLSPSAWLCRSFFTLSIVFLPNSLRLSSDLAFLFYDGLGEHCRELGFGRGVLARLRAGALGGLGVPRGWWSSWHGVPAVPAWGPGLDSAQAASRVSVQQTHAPPRQLAR